MKFDRIPIAPRPTWQHKVSDVGMYYHTIDDKTYWNEEAYYVLDSELVDKIEDATTRLHKMSIEVLSYIIQNKYYKGYNLSEKDIDLIEASWKNGHQHVYGRFDMGIDRNYNIKLFEYNADTPTSLLEASVIQWNWKEEVLPNYDQFNSIHEKLIARWKEIIPPLKSVYFTTMTDAPYEDWGNLHYLMETASLSGFNTSSINLEVIGWDGTQFVDLNHIPINYLFKLYPWEWMNQDEFYDNIMKSNTVFIEPPWKMLLSNKMILAKLWEYYPNHDLLLEAYDPKIGMMRDILNFTRVCKPKLGREGQDIFYTNNAFPLNHSNGDTILQAKFPVIDFNGIQPVIGSWIIGDESVGIGIREDYGITTNNSKFVPHVFY